MRWECTIPGDPVGKGRPRFSTTRLGRPRVFTPQRTRDWEAGAAAIMRMSWGGAASLGTAVSLEVEAVFNRPVRLSREKDTSGRIPHVTTPDIDNCAKAASDALQQAGVVLDDKQVTRLVATKAYAAKGEQAHVKITVVVEN